MAVKTVYRRRTPWPEALVLVGSVVAVLVALVGDSSATTASAIMFVLTAVLLTALARRDKHGSHSSPAAWRAAIAASAVAAGLLLVLADRAVVAFALVAVAAVFCLAVVLLGILVMIASITNPPGWMLDADGQLVGLLPRMKLAAYHWSRRARGRRGRSPEQIFGQISRDLARSVWREGQDEATAYSHLHVVLHPESAEALDAWMPIEEVAADLARSYAAAHRSLRRKSGGVTVMISSDPEVPVGIGAISASFREAHPLAPKARAMASMGASVGPPKFGEAIRFAPDASPANPPTRLMAPGEGHREEARDHIAAGPDAVTLLLAEPGEGAAAPGRAAFGSHSSGVERTVAAGYEADVTCADTTATDAVGTGHPSPALRLWPCLPDGSPLPGSRPYVLDGTRRWTVGRDRRADVQLGNSQVSRHHLDLHVSSGRWVVADRSRLGTRLNERLLPAGTEVLIEPGDILELGRVGRESADRVLLRIE